MKEALELQREWGDKPCDHPQVVKEYHLGTQTGDRVCTKCGYSASPEYFSKNREIGLLAGHIHGCPKCGEPGTMTKRANDGLHHCSSCGHKEKFKM